MKKIINKRKLVFIIIISLIVITFIIAGILLNIQNRTLKKEVEEFAIKYEDGVKINTSEELLKNKKIGNLEISNIRLSYTNGISILLADVINVGNTKTKETEIKVEILDKNENVLIELNGVIYSLNPNEKFELNLNTNIDIANAYDFRISNK